MLEEEAEEAIVDVGNVARTGILPEIVLKGVVEEGATTSVETVERYVINSVYLRNGKWLHFPSPGRTHSFRLS